MAERSQAILPNVSVYLKFSWSGGGKICADALSTGTETEFGSEESYTRYYCFP